MVSRIDSVQAARLHSPAAVSARIDVIPPGQGGGAENPQRGDDCKRDESRLLPHARLLHCCRAAAPSLRDAVESRVLPRRGRQLFGEHHVFEIGSPGRIRTSDQPVNSRLLYH